MRTLTPLTPRFAFLKTKPYTSYHYLYRGKRSREWRAFKPLFMNSPLFKTKAQ